MRQIFIAILLSPLTTSSQPNFSSTWRLKNSQLIEGQNYLNALPFTMTIRHNDNVIEFITTKDMGDRDTVEIEVLSFGVNSGMTKTLKKKVVTFQKEEDSSWLKETKIFAKDDSTKPQLLDRQTFKFFPEDNKLILTRTFDAREDPKENYQDFIMVGTFEKISPQQLALETATGNGVKFVEGLTWDQIKSKAKKENKYIFVDCYATWCGPCKVMDKYVYPLNMVGEAINDDFISVKVQVDTTEADSSHIKMLYPLARKLEKEYNIKALPSYLFFSPDGSPVHKTTGQLKANEFVKLLATAKNPKEQLYTLFKKAKNKEFPWSDYPEIIKKLRSGGKEKELAKDISVIYYREFLNRIDEKDLLLKPNLEFIDTYKDLVSSKDRIFQLCFTNPKLVNSVIEDTSNSWAKDVILFPTIIREEILPSLKEEVRTGKEPDWKKLNNRIAKKYGKELATTLVLGERVNFYWKKRNWTLFLQYVKPYLSRLDFGKTNPVYVHWCAWFVFKYSEDRMLILDAVTWVNALLRNIQLKDQAIFLDTKACLLYKLGKKEDSITLLKEMIEIYPEYSGNASFRLEQIHSGESDWSKFE